MRGSRKGETAERETSTLSDALQRFAADPILAVLFLSLVTACAGMLALLFDRLGGGLGKVVRPSTNKLSSLEGLRGILACSVVAHHAYCWYFFTQTGEWTTGRSVIFARLASFGVLQFFFVSGFLFWRKLMKRGEIPLGSFYLSRFVRIGPVYYACFGIAVVTGLVVSGFRLQVGVGALLGSLLPWLLFGVGGRPAVNHADILRITCGVTWTLTLEWMFYLLLPFLAWFSRKNWRLLILLGIFAPLSLVNKYSLFGGVNAGYAHVIGMELAKFAKFMLIGFGGGILIAALEPRIRNWSRVVQPWQNWMLLGLYLAYLAIPNLDAVTDVFLLAGFALVVQGADLFGFLTSRAVRLLGIISYPIYLVHGVVYYMAMKLRGGMHAVALLPYMAETAGCVAAAILLATAIHLLIERPTMKLSENIAGKTALPQTVLLEPTAQVAVSR
jgi:peptidoglycan/LPS O-acetylase OafA/YrhL